ncbi:unnamed protein product [Paramecium sonneborni]|uniref:UTP-monosaccharide-1-phosphate uridylyltransferase n=1 Tax=Paramecium sonneborni TaxID=65129 RepID=A0A8S1QWG1_9CILI|nr:unnamed protein product [Paramecium sonneborni]
MNQDIQTQEQLIEYLSQIDQQHLITYINNYTQQQVTEFIDQINQLNKNYPGGIKEYANRARKLLLDASEDVNPFAEYTAHVPQGQNVDIYSDEYLRLEQLGVEEIKDTCFVLVAGGLGERLGYDGIKVGLPIDLVTNTTYLEYYCQFILNLQRKHGNKQLPFAIMTSDDTHKLTLQLLENNLYFGLQKEQVNLIKQEKVPAMLDNLAHFAQIPGKLLIDTKPHGHGDIHTLLYMSGLAQKWKNEGRKWLFIFQDTNAQAFRALPVVLGVSKENQFELNSVVVSRKPGEAVGAICYLVDKNNKGLTLNVEYNQLDPLVKAQGGEPVDEQGYSKYPGNINCLLFSLNEYETVLQETKGLIAEFINPKYADATKTKFKSSSRLECMMQDYPKLLGPQNKVGFTALNRRFCFSACKNDLNTALAKQKTNLPLECAASSENDFYWLNAELLRMAGVTIPDSISDEVNYNGLEFKFGPKIVLHPSFGVTLSEIKSRIKGKVQISSNSTVILGGQAELHSVNIDGYAQLFGNGQFNVDIKDLNSPKLVSLEQQDGIPGYLKIRGYRLQK